ncbi:MAG: Gfo/Idh/MocA family protein [Halobacteriota archaeon]
MQELKVGVVGLGKMGLLHAGIFNQLAPRGFVAAAEKDKLTRNLLKAYMPQITVYDDYEAMFEREELDVAAIATPVFLHKPVIDSALDNDCHIFVEKPLALNGEECRALLRASTDKKSQVGYNRRFLETYKMAKQILDDSVLGELKYVQSQMFETQVLRKEGGWRFDPSKSGGGVIIDLGAHVIDMLHYLVGPLASVHGAARSVYSDTVDDFASIALQFANGLTGSLELSWSVRHYRLPEMRILMQFDKGTIAVTEKYIEIYSEEAGGSLKQGWNTFHLQNLTKGVPIDLGGPEYTAEDAQLLDCIGDGNAPLCNFHEAAKTNFVIDAIYDSTNTGQTKKVQYGV